MIAARLEVAEQALATAEVEYRQFAQQAVSDGKSKAQLALLLGRIEEKRAEAAFLRGQLERSRVVAPQDGVALFDDRSDLDQSISAVWVVMASCAPTIQEWTC